MARAAACTRNGIGHALLFERRGTLGSETKLSATDAAESGQPGCSLSAAASPHAMERGHA